MDSPDSNSDQKKNEQFKFTGMAMDYFAIWLINNMFTLLTLGIYSAWAKVRTLQFFYGNTEIAGGRFQFTADPLKILRGRIIAVLLLILYLVVENVQSTLATIVLFTILGAYFIFAPILTVFVMSFKLRYSEWRGISFRFNHNFREAYRIYLIPMLLMGLFFASFALPFNSTEVEEYFGFESPVYQAQEYLEDEEIYAGEAYGEDTEADTQLREEPLDELLAEDELDEYYVEQGEEEDTYMNPYFFIPAVLLGLVFMVLLPYFDFIHIRFLSRNTRLGTAHFNYIAKLNDYYFIYAKWAAAVLVLVALWGLEWFYDIFDKADLWWMLLVITVIAIPATRSYFKSQRYNLLLNKTLVDNKHQLRANTSFLGMFWLMLSNSVVVILTLGMMKPWAQVRTARYLMASSSLDVDGSLDDFVAAQEENSSALAEEVADIFDLELLG